VILLFPVPIRLGNPKERDKPRPSLADLILAHYVKDTYHCDASDVVTFSEVPLSSLIRRSAPLLALAALGTGLACSSSTPDNATATTTTPTTEAAEPAETKGIAVAMKEWTVTPETNTAKPGSVTFNARNEGTKTHELVLFKTDLPADQLPLDEDGAVDEAGTGVELVEEVEDVEAGTTKSFTAEVTPGKYFLVCNLVDADTGDKHFGHQMYAPFTVQ
jgi:plastocyanin